MCLVLNLYTDIRLGIYTLQSVSRYFNEQTVYTCVYIYIYK